MRQILSSSLHIFLSLPLSSSLFLSLPLSPPLSLMLLFLISYRHSRSSTSPSMKSVLKGHNIWVMLYEITRWDKYSLHLSVSVSVSLSHPTISCFIQSLRELYLFSNQIGAEGAQHLSDALRNNTVRQILSSSLYLSLIQLFLISYRHSRNSTSAPIKSEMKGCNIWALYYEITRYDIYSFYLSISLSLSHPTLFLFHTDTYYTRPLQKSNRRWRRTTSEWCITI